MARDRAKKNQEASGGAGWLCTFNDLMTLLMVFFVLVFSMGSVDLKKTGGLIGSLQSGLGVLEAGSHVDVTVVDPQPAVQTLENDMGNISEVYNEIIADLAEHEKRPVHDDEIIEAINYLPNRRLSPVEVIPGVSATYTPEGIYISLADHLLFKSGESAINPMGYPVLNKIIKSIDTKGYAVRIEGHTDNVPIHTEKYPSNWDLSADRAIKVLKYFIRFGNISPTRLSAVGYADAKPVAENDSDENRARNRRVEIVLYKGGQS